MNQEKIYYISDASKKVQVESHVLRYWEDELKLPIKRNDMGHRYYTEEDIQEFMEIKQLKEQGLQLKAIRMILNNGRLIPIETSLECKGRSELETKEQEDPSKRLQLLFRRMIAEVVEENNKKMLYGISEMITKELDYQFRMQEEREEQRANRQMLLDEEHYRQLDSILRDYTKNTKKKRDTFFRKKLHHKESDSKE